MTLEDDNFHPPESDDWWEHETVWFWFFHPERKLGCWSYHYVRPNIGVAGGGVFVFDDSAWSHWEAPYYVSDTNARIPEPCDLRDVTFGSGQRIQMLAPHEHYRLTFGDRDTIAFDLDWRAAGPPWVRTTRDRRVQGGDGAGADVPRHLDQFGHVTGSLRLHGDELAIDCYAMRDRSWWHLRPEQWKDHGGRSTYITAMASPDTAFFGAGPGGFLVLDGVRSDLVEGTKRRERDAEHGFVRHVVVDARDAEGRELHAEGEAVSRMAIPISGVHGVCWQSLVHWSINGVEAWGDDQDAWPLQQWSAFRRTQMGLPDARGSRRRRVDLTLSLEGRVALVTGAGRGIGRAHALLLAERGASVVVCDVGAALDGRGRDASVAQAVVDEIRRRGGVAHPDDSDVSSLAGGASAVDATLEAFGRLDIVVNNAGLAAGAPLADVTGSDLDRVLAVNFVGPLATARAAWPSLASGGHGRIVNTVSEAAFDARQWGGQVGYGAAKAAVWSLTLTLAEAGRRDGITANAVSPGAFTRMNEAMFREQGRPEGLDLDPAHVARVVAWLVSDDAADITGRVLHVAGGHHREYTIRREADTELVRRVEAALRARPTASP